MDPGELDDESDDEADAEALACTAKLEIRWAAKMSDAERTGVADWLRRQADQLVGEGGNYAALFTARLDPED